MRKSVCLFIVLLGSFWLSAHEFWIEPDKFYYEPAASVQLRFMVGENYQGENWSGNRASVAQLHLYQGDWEDDMTEDLGTHAGDSLEFSLTEAGTAMVILETKNKFIQLEADKFNEYLKEDGLSTAEAFRAANNERDSIGREYYRRSVKTIIQVGDQYSHRCTKKTSLPLDIIPTVNPYQRPEADSAEFTVLFKGKPLANQLVKIWHKTKEGTILQNKTTNEQGTLSFSCQTMGSWMVSTVLMERAVVDSVQWQSYWGSCTWGYNK